MRERANSVPESLGFSNGDPGKLAENFAIWTLQHSYRDESRKAWNET